MAIIEATDTCDALEVCDKCSDTYLWWQSANHQSICEGK